MGHSRSVSASDGMSNNMRQCLPEKLVHSGWGLELSWDRTWIPSLVVTQGVLGPYNLMNSKSIRATTSTDFRTCFILLVNISWISLSIKFATMQYFCCLRSSYPVLSSIGPEIRMCDVAAVICFSCCHPFSSSALTFSSYRTYFSRDFSDFF